MDLTLYSVVSNGEEKENRRDWMIMKYMFLDCHLSDSVSFTSNHTQLLISNLHYSVIILPDHEGHPK